MPESPKPVLAKVTLIGQASYQDTGIIMGTIRNTTAALPAKR